MADVAVPVGEGEKKEPAAAPEVPPSAATPAEEPAKKQVGFDVEDSNAKGYAPKTEEVDEIKAASAKGRQTTFQKMRQTLKEGAQEMGTAVSDATSFTLANTVENIVVATARMIRKEGGWGGPAGLALSEAFVLLWVDNHGDIPGRKNSATLQAILYGCLLCDLIAINKLDVQKFNKKMGPMSWERFIISPTGPEALNNFLDPAFQSIKENYDKGERRTIAKWVEVVATSVNEGTETVDDVVFSLCDKNILKQEKKTMLLVETRRWPMGEGGQKVLEELIAALRKVLLDDEPPSIFLRSLLRWMRAADSDFTFGNPFYDKALKTKAERQKAQKMIQNSDRLEGEKGAAVPEKT